MQDINRIVSLSPSLTRQVIDLNAEDLLVGVTSYHPPLVRKIEIVGSIVQPSIEKIMLLKPDVVLFSEEDSATQKIDTLKNAGLNTVKFKRNKDFTSLCRNYILLGKLLNREALAREKINSYKEELNRITQEASQQPVAFLVSHLPLITVSDQSFIGHIIKDAGGINVFGDLQNSYPVISKESLVQRKPQIIYIMSEGGDVYVRALVENIDAEQSKKIKIYTVDSGHIPYYTPADYIISVRLLSSFMAQGK